MPISIFPDEETLKQLLTITPDYAHPNSQPYAVVAEGYLSFEQCHQIINMYDAYDPYKLGHCGAITREMNAPMNGALGVAEDFALGVNKMFWQYDIDPSGAAWLQTYEKNGDYQKHTDTYAGQSRKLTAVILLSEESLYDGGDLVIETWPKPLTVPRAQGTIVMFQAWHQHYVKEVTRGLRQTVNMGFWGPQFR